MWTQTQHRYASMKHLILDFNTSIRTIKAQTSILWIWTRRVIPCINIIKGIISLTRPRVAVWLSFFCWTQRQMFSRILNWIYTFIDFSPCNESDWGGMKILSIWSGHSYAVILQRLQRRLLLILIQHYYDFYGSIVHIFSFLSLCNTIDLFYYFLSWEYWGELMKLRCSSCVMTDLGSVMLFLISVSIVIHDRCISAHASLTQMISKMIFYSRYCDANTSLPWTGRVPSSKILEKNTK